MASRIDIIVVCWNDKEKIAGMVSYPMNFIHDGKRARIRDKATFLARYDSIFDEHVRATILKQSSYCLFGNANGEMIGNGEVWFSELGDGSVKIITVNSSVNNFIFGGVGTIAP